jgi:hypothetical protein
VEKPSGEIFPRSSVLCFFAFCPICLHALLTILPFSASDPQPFIVAVLYKTIMTFGNKDNPIALIYVLEITVFLSTLYL